MSQQQVYVCDGCGTHKQAANHWFKVLDKDGALSVRRWDECDLSDSEQHYCGAECANKRISQFIGQR